MSGYDGRYDGMTDAELYREYAEEQLDLAAAHPEAVAYQERALEWEQMAQRADEAEAAAR